MTSSTSDRRGQERIAERPHARARGRYFTLRQAADEYPAFPLRLLRRLVQERRIPFSRVGRCIVVAESDIEAYVEENRVEPPKSPRYWGLAS